MDAEKILTILVNIYCEQKNLTLEELEIKKKNQGKKTEETA